MRRLSNVRLGVVDGSRTPESRELIAALSESKSFRLTGYYPSADRLGDAISRGELDAGVAIPYDYARDLQRGRPTTVQFLLNAMNANTAAISQGYAEGVIQTYNHALRAGKEYMPIFSRPRHRAQVSAVKCCCSPAFLYNPGLVDSWFIVTGVFGLLLILNSSLVASGAMVKEREAGTIEQLLMSPAGTSEIIIAKIAPLFFLLSLMALFAVGVIRVAFKSPLSWQPAARAVRRGSVRSVRHRPRHSHRHIQQIGAAGNTDELLRESSDGFIVRSP